MLLWVPGLAGNGGRKRGERISFRLLRRPADLYLRLLYPQLCHNHMEQNFLPGSSPPVPNKNRIIPTKFLLLAGLVILVLAEFGYYLWLRTRLLTPVSTSTPAPQGNREVSSDELVKFLVQRSSLSLPLSVSSSPASSGHMPKYAEELVLPSATGISYEKAVFQGDKNGFIIKYNVVQRLADAYRSFVGVSFKNWDRKFATRTDNVGLIDFGNGSRMARIILKINGSGTEISITLVN